MVTQNARVEKTINRTLNRGYSLVEMLVSIGLATLLLTVLTSFIISGGFTAHKQIRLLLLQNSVSDALRFIQDDLRRANAAVTSESELRYVILDGNEHHFTVIKADYTDHKLKYCSDTVVQPFLSSTCNRFYSIFDSHQLQLVNFAVREKRIEQEEGSVIDSALYEISLTAKLRDLDQSFRLSVSIAFR